MAHRSGRIVNPATNRRAQPVQRSDVAPKGKTCRPSTELVAPGRQIDRDGRMSCQIDEPSAKAYPMSGFSVSDLESNLVIRLARKSRELTSPLQELARVGVELLSANVPSISRCHYEMPPALVVNAHLSQFDPGSARQ